MENQLKVRRYELDWLRVLAFSLLIFYHTGMFFVSWEWHVKNTEISKTMELPMLFLSQWRMSLIFFISGAGVYYAIGYRNTGTFLKDRLKRIFVPLLFGIFLIVPPQIYLERLTQGSTQSLATFYSSTFNFVPYPEGNFSWHHLWYLAYIFSYSILLLPLLKYFRNKTAFFEKAQSWSLLLFPALWLSTGEVLLREKFGSTHALVNDWANHFLYVSVFLLGYIILSNAVLQEKIRKIRWYSLSLGVLLIIFLYVNYWLSSTNSEASNLTLYYLLKSCNRWFWIMAILGFALQHLNIKSPFLKQANEMVYPFYILHQTVIVAIAYFLINQPWSIGIKFMLIVTATFLICFILIKHLIMRTNLLRIPFGLKPLPLVHTEQTPPVLHQTA